VSRPFAVERPEGAADFDFLHGEWLVRHRKLVRRLTGCDEWQTFSGAIRAATILAGLGNIDENVIDAPSGRYEALTVRTFDPETSLWTIHWIDGRDPKPDAPVTGSFVDGVGTFLGTDVLDGRPIEIRFVWSDVTATTARWEQAFSSDGGATWEVNWRMDFRRLLPSKGSGQWK
jgi:hypothetical protein